MKLVLRTIDPRHGRDIPTGRKIARALRVIFRRQQREVLAKLRQNPERVPSLNHWTAPMATAMEPLLHGYYAEGIRAAMRRIRRQVRDAKSDNRGGRHLSASTASGNRGHAEGSGAVPGGRDLRFFVDHRTPGDQSRRVVHKDEGDPGRILDVFDPAFDVFNPRVLDAIRDAVFAFCDATNQTATRDLGQAIQDLRRELSAGLERGEALRELTARVQEIFDDPARAFRIATTEASRAVHTGQYLAAVDSGVVQGKRWLLSSDACPICKGIAATNPEVSLDEDFAVIGTGPYSRIPYPPAHPHCQCSWTEVLA